MKLKSKEEIEITLQEKLKGLGDIEKALEDIGGNIKDIESKSEQELGKNFEIILSGFNREYKRLSELKSEYNNDICNLKSLI